MDQLYVLYANELQICLAPLRSHTFPPFSAGGRESSHRTGWGLNLVNYKGLREKELFSGFCLQVSELPKKKWGEQIKLNSVIWIKKRSRKEKYKGSTVGERAVHSDYKDSKSQELRDARLGGLVFLKGVGVSDVAGVGRSRHRGS